MRRDDRYVLHGSVTDPGGEPWELYEFAVDGRAALLADPAGHQIANAATSFPRDARFILFELSVERAFSTVYGADGQPVRRRWQAS